MTVEYVDAGEAIDQGLLSGKTPGGEIAPPVAADVTYERILDARSEPQNWLTYYGAYNGQRYSPLDQINTENVKRLATRLGLPGRHERHHRGRVDLLVRGRPDRRRRDHVPLRLGRLGLGPRREDGHGDLAVQARDPLRRVAVLREREPWGRRGPGEGLLRHGERPRARARRHHRQAGLGQDLRRRAGRGERHGRAAGREEHGHRRELRRGVRGARPPGRVRHRDRRAPVALLHGPEARGARLRDLARRRRGLGAWWRELLDHRHLRPGDEPAVRGHRQPGARLRRRRPRGRQPLHRQHHRRRRRRRPDPLALPVHPARRVGLRQHRGVHPVREGRAQAARALRQERLLLRRGSHERRAGPDHPLRGPDHLGGDHAGTAR